MPFTRVWDASCPRVYDRWEQDGASWVIQDLPPEDDEEALTLLVEQMAPDEALCTAVGILNDKLSMLSMTEYWRRCLAKRMSLACYVTTDNSTRTLAAVNCCLVACSGDEEEICEVEGEKWQHVYHALHYAETRVNMFKYLSLDSVLCTMGLLVCREFRGAKLGARMLKAREPLGLAQGIKATSTVFTGVAAQKCADKAGFRTVAEVTFKQLAGVGLPYPATDQSVKVMVKKFEDLFILSSFLYHLSSHCHTKHLQHQRRCVASLKAPLHSRRIYSTKQS